MFIDTSELCDLYAEQVDVVEPIFSSFGGVSNFYGKVTTVKCFESNGLIEKVLEELNGEKSKAKFVSVIALVRPDGSEITFRGECHGEIIFEKRGSNGFGYDPIFYVPSLEKTFAELTPEQKNSISHRKESLEKFSKYLKEEDYEN